MVYASPSLGAHLGGVRMCHSTSGKENTNGQSLSPHTCLYNLASKGLVVIEVEKLFRNKYTPFVRTIDGGHA
jgi:hypothetical protein